MLISKAINFKIVVLFTTWCLVVIYRYLTLLNFGFHYVDADQTVMWAGLNDYSSGNWYEPRFYGQDYNSMLEALLAVPLYKLGIAPYKALPIVTTFLCLGSFSLLFFEAYLQKKYFQAFLISCLPLLLPYEYALITTLPRGFLPGIFIGSIAIFRSGPFAGNSANVRFGLLSVIAFSLNPNSAFLSFITLVERLSDYKKAPGSLLYALIGVFVGIALHYTIQYYYVLHPEAIVHRMMGTQFSFSLLISQLQDLDRIFNDICPVFWNSGFIIILVFPILSIILFYQKMKLRAWAMLAVTFLIFGSLGLGKSIDGSTSVIFPYSRLFLALPLVIGIGLSWIKLNLKLSLVMLLVPILYFFIHFQEFTVTVPNKLIRNNVIAVTKVHRLEKMCKDIQMLAAKYQVKLIVINNSYYGDLINYGCKACTEDFPNSIKSQYERRTWLKMRFNDSVYKNILVIDADRKRNDTIAERFALADSALYLIKDNKLKTKQLLEELRIH